MNDTHFYHGTTKKLQIAFEHIFNGIQVVRYNSSNEEEHRLSVPILYGTKEKWFIRQTQDPNYEKKVQQILPRMGYEISSFTYDATRHLQSLKKRSFETDDETRSWVYTPVPYNVGFTLYIQSKNIDDGLQIFEQILPFFGPSSVMTINTIPELGIQDEVPFVLNSIQQQHEYEGDFDKHRILMWVLQFTAKANYYGPIFDQSTIKHTRTNIHIGTGSDAFTASEMASTPISASITSDVDPVTAGLEDTYEIDRTITELLYENIEGDVLQVSTEPVVISVGRRN